MQKNAQAQSPAQDSDYVPSHQETTQELRVRERKVQNQLMFVGVAIVLLSAILCVDLWRDYKEYRVTHFWEAFNARADDAHAACFSALEARISHEIDLVVNPDLVNAAKAVAERKQNHHDNQMRVLKSAWTSTLPPQNGTKTQNAALKALLILSEGDFETNFAVIRKYERIFARDVWLANNTTESNDGDQERAKNVYERVLKPYEQYVQEQIDFVGRRISLKQAIVREVNDELRNNLLWGDLDVALSAQCDAPSGVTGQDVLDVVLAQSEALAHKLAKIGG